MGCPHHPNRGYVEEGGRLVCPECGYVAPYQSAKSYAELLGENQVLRKYLRDKLEKNNDHDLEDEIRGYLDE